MEDIIRKTNLLNRIGEIIRQNPGITKEDLVECYREVEKEFAN